jgi:hypothetical protein
MWAAIHLFPLYLLLWLRDVLSRSVTWSYWKSLLVGGVRFWDRTWAGGPAGDHDKTFVDVRSSLEVELAPRNILF